ncbi:hypothetical protein ASPZODRAFT_12708 [Penicilliopsis zonata CBS 506.65]|uniref:MICOS complex subunit MIC12 n=1 Tax=Penicilliopsis zonata CBS 506.65 TaxID=1073090 RepID=A0A1L9SQT8_9EURO|nr:hypothetical protein ASPZODRAFT_12708 [Penicilliopsis zonata CBS 506.65]OJJ49580.1 hypothetical protein ASPZODRAFT_12708 [Penicilliopsis zonata CBS 506.65]
MGFFTGFFSGFALTTCALYLTVQVHRSNRLEQRSLIREQTQAIEWLGSPAGAYDRRFAPKELSRLRETRDGEKTSTTPTVQDLLKHRWNKEVETLAKKAYESSWEDARLIAVAGWKAAVRLVKKE